MPMFRAYGLSPSMRRSSNQISPPSSEWKPAISRRSVVLPQPEGPSSVNNSPSPISRLASSTAVTLPNCLRTWRSLIFTVGAGPPRRRRARAARTLRLPPGRLDVRAELLLERVRPLLRDVFVVDVRDLALEIRPHAARELHRQLGGRARRALHLVLRRDREEPPLHEDLLPTLAQEELDEGARSLRIAGAREDRHGLGRDEGVLRSHELELEARELLLERHVRGDGETGAVLALGHDGRHVAAPRGEVPGVRGELPEPLPAPVLPVHGQDHFVGRVRRRGARGRALGDLALELRVQQVVPFAGLGNAEALDLPGVVDEPVRLERGADPEAVLVLERDGPGLADRHGDRLPHLARDLDLLQELLLGELLEEGRLTAPEDVDLRLALPLDDAAVGDRRSRRDRAHLHRDVPLLLRVVGERLERRVVDELRHRRDQRQLALDRRLPQGRARRAGDEKDRQPQDPESFLQSSPLMGSSTPWTSPPPAASHRNAPPVRARPEEVRTSARGSSAVRRHPASARRPRPAPPGRLRGAPSSR